MSRLAKREYKTLSKRVRQLLELQEGLDVEFKKEVRGLEGKDLVAFANAGNDGAILIGVSEIKSNGEVQRGEITGCPVDDGSKLMIVNKAEDCIPPVEVEVFIENLKDKPFFRVEIPSRLNGKRPYATKKGIYTTRGDGRTKPLLPGRLLTLFAETEAEEFLGRFKEATRKLETDLLSLKGRVEEEMTSLMHTVDTMHNLVTEELQEISGAAADAQANSEDGMLMSDEALGWLRDIGQQVEHMENLAYDTYDIVNLLREHFGLEHPSITKVRKVAYSEARSFFKMEKRKPSRQEIFDLLTELYRNEDENLLLEISNEVFEKYDSGDTDGKNVNSL